MIQDEDKPITGIHTPNDEVFNNTCDKLEKIPYI